MDTPVGNGPGEEEQVRRALEDPERLKRIAADIRHRNDTLTPGRIVHFVDAAHVCLAAIVIDVRPSSSLDAMLHVFVAKPDTISDFRVWALRADPPGRWPPGSWHFAIECPAAASPAGTPEVTPGVGGSTPAGSSP